MSRVCEISGKRAQFGNNVSKAMNKTKRRFEVNLIKKRFYIPEEDKWITLKVSTSVLKTINRKGIAAVLKEAKEKVTSDRIVLDNIRVDFKDALRGNAFPLATLF